MCKSTNCKLERLERESTELALRLSRTKGAVIAINAMMHDWPPAAAMRAELNKRVTDLYRQVDTIDLEISILEELL